MTFTTAKNLRAASKLPSPLGEGWGEGAAVPLPSRRAREIAGFTLLEMMLVLAILAAMGAIAWPLITRAYESTKLKNAAEQVQASFGHARVQAMTSGLPQVFHFEANTGNYSVDVWQDGTEAVEGNAGTASTAAGGFSAGSTASSTADGTSGSSTPACSYKLPDGFTFAAADRVLDNRAAAAEAGLSSAGIDTSSPPILFYPDGTTSEAKVTIANQNSRSITVSLRGLTGLAKLGEITTTDATGGTGP